MSEDINDLMSGFNNQSYNIDITVLAAKLLENSIRSNEYLRTIIGQQLELQELIKGQANDIDEVVDEKYTELMRKIDELVQKDFYSAIGDITKS